MKIRPLKEKIYRYSRILQYYGIKPTFAYYLSQQSETKHFSLRKKIILEFVYNLRKKAGINNLSDKSDVVEVKRDFPKIIWTMWQQGEDQMPETVKASIKTIKSFAEKNGCEFNLLTDENLHNFLEIPKSEMSISEINSSIAFLTNLYRSLSSSVSNGNICILNLDKSKSIFSSSTKF